MNKNSLNRLLITLAIIFVIGILVYQMFQQRKRMEMRARADELAKIVEEVEAKIDAKSEKEVLEDINHHDYLKDLETKKMIKPKIWAFTQKQPNWILLPKPDYEEQSINGLNLRINSNQAVSLTNNKEEWSSQKYRTLTVECGPVFEKVEVEVTLINEHDAKILISKKLLLKEGYASLRMSEDKAFTGKITELQLRIKNTNPRNFSVFNLKTIQLSN